MRLTNPTEHVILFKIKTTAPKKYCVRPNCGTLEPRTTIEIAIILQPFIFDAAEKNKHKFMVQSMIMPDSEVSIEQLWKDVSPDDLMDSKLRCVFELPADTNQTALGGAAITATSTTTTQSANATPNKNESGTQVVDPQHVSSASNEEDSDALILEVKKLRESECSLRHENLLLKEKVLRMRLDIENSAAKEQQQQSSVSSGLGSGGSPASVSAAAAAQYQNPYSPPQLANQQQLPIIYVAAAIAMAIFGLILGKFVL